MTILEILQDNNKIKVGEFFLLETATEDPVLTKYWVYLVKKLWNDKGDIDFIPDENNSGFKGSGLFGIELLVRDGQ